MAYTITGSDRSLCGVLDIIQHNSELIGKKRKMPNKNICSILGFSFHDRKMGFYSLCIYPIHLSNIIGLCRLLAKISWQSTPPLLILVNVCRLFNTELLQDPRITVNWTNEFESICQRKFAFTEMHFNMLAAKWRRYYSGQMTLESICRSRKEMSM